jgi:hypothetical protein
MANRDAPLWKRMHAAHRRGDRLRADLRALSTLKT